MPGRLFAKLVIVTGLVLLCVGLGYLLYTRLAVQNLDSLIVGPVSGTPTNPGSAQVTLEPSPAEQPRSPTMEPPTVTPEFRPTDHSVSFYPGSLMNAQSWAAPWLSLSPTVADSDLLDGYLPIDDTQAPKMGTLPRASRILIPSIELVAPVQELSIIDLENSRSFETPNRVVGHIPSTANPGEKGNGWFFGHLESPLLKEGSIFRDLPKIPGLVRQGEVVRIILETESGNFLYEVTETNVVHEDQFRIIESGTASVTLVTCVPALVYDHRLVVVAELTGFKLGE